MNSEVLSYDNENESSVESDEISMANEETDESSEETTETDETEIIESAQSTEIIVDLNYDNFDTNLNDLGLVSVLLIIAVFIGSIFAIGGFKLD